MKNIKIDEPVFRDKPLTNQDLKEREYMYLMGKEEYERKRGKMRGRISSGQSVVRPDADKRPDLYVHKSNKRFSWSGCLDAFCWLLKIACFICIVFLLVCVFSHYDLSEIAKGLLEIF